MSQGGSDTVSKDNIIGINEASEKVVVSELENLQRNSEGFAEASSEENEVDDLNEERTMRSILNEQCIIQFRQHAQEQYPKDVAKQDEFIKKMQDQYFEYYMENVQRSQFVNQQYQINQLMKLREAANGTDEEDVMGEPVPLPLIPASMWVRKNIADFKKDILENSRECCIKISSLSTATLRVPTHEDAGSIFWEFATDWYDLGFGLYFEWSLTPQEDISITISESSDEEEECEDGEDEERHAHDPEVGEGSQKVRNPFADESDVERGASGSINGRRKLTNCPPIDELIPIYRRDCHVDVYCGSHQYPGCGVYVFKFDNSFSLWRSKWLYYRVFYGK